MDIRIRYLLLIIEKSPLSLANVTKNIKNFESSSSRIFKSIFSIFEESIVFNTARFYKQDMIQIGTTKIKLVITIDFNA